MLKVFGLIAVLLCTTTPAWTWQAPAGNLEEAARIADLLNDNKYVEALDAISRGLDRVRYGRDGEDPLTYWAYLARIWIDAGKLDRAESTLRTAEDRLRRTWDEHWAAIVARERTALTIIRGEYASGRDAGLRAARLAERFHPNRPAYCLALAAIASFHAGDKASAQSLMQRALKAVPRKARSQSFYVPRILFAACEIEAGSGRIPDAESYCRKGLQTVSASQRKTRDQAIGQLALARMYLAAGRLTDSREAATASAEIAVSLFGKQHQDNASALELLAQIDFREGKLEAARNRAQEAISISTVVIGDSATRTELLRRAMAPVLAPTTP